MLGGIGLEPAAQATYTIVLALLREGTVRHGLSLAAVAGLLGRDPLDPAEPSWLERRTGPGARPDRCFVGPRPKWDNSFLCGPARTIRLHARPPGPRLPSRT